jgi:hypothetical protein
VFVDEPPLDTPPAADQVEASLFGPGFGEAIAVHLGDGSWFLVDSCQRQDDKFASLAYLVDLGVDVSSSVVGVLATHWHVDHVRGLCTLFSAAAGARFFCSRALLSGEFAALTASKPTPSRFPVATAEISAVIAEVEQRRLSGGPPVSQVSAATRMYQGAGVVAELWALSPSDEDVRRSNLQVSAMAAKAAGNAFRPPALSANDASVVMFAASAAGNVLFGADLENFSSDRQRGWLAIVDSSVRPTAKSSLLKVPHHGGASGHCTEMWDHLLISRPISILTPWELGSGRLPTAQDVARLRGKSASTHISSNRERPAVRHSAAVDKTIRETARSFAPVRLEMGHIQVRSAGTEWMVRSSSSAVAFTP